VFVCPTIAEARTVIQERTLGALVLGLPMSEEHVHELIPLARTRGSLVIVLGDDLGRAESEVLKKAGAVVRNKPVAAKEILLFAEAGLQAARSRRVDVA
jgi:hypothetical protein